MSWLYKMTWEKSKQRWRKMYHGRIYTISPQSLGCPPTKDESYQAANVWWEAKLTEIKGQPPVLSILSRNRSPRDTSHLPIGYDYLINYVRRSASDTSIPESEVREIVPPSENLLLWGETLSGVKKPTPADRTIGHWVGKFLALRKDEVIGKELSIAQYELIRLCLDKFKEWMGMTRVSTRLPQIGGLIGIDICLLSTSLSSIRKSV